MEDISCEELKERMTQKETIHIIDVREPWEHEERKIEGSTLIPLGTLQNRVSEIAHLKDEEIVVHCQTGIRSFTAKRYLTSQGFSKVRNLEGGIQAYGWA